MIEKSCTGAMIKVDYDHRQKPETAPMLRPLLFAPVIIWVVRALQKAGMRRILILTRPELLPYLQSLEGLVTLALLDAEDTMDRVRELGECSEDEVLMLNRPAWIGFHGAELIAEGMLHRAAAECEGAVMLPASFVAGAKTLDDLKTGIPLPVDADFFVNLTEETDFSELQETARMDYVCCLLERGVRMLAPGSAYIDPSVEIEPGAVLLPNVILRGRTFIGRGCEIGPDTMIRDCILGEDCGVNSSQLNEAVFGNKVNIGPYAYVRPGTRVADGCKVGDFVEVKNASIGAGTKLPHLIYVGDADVGERCNFGCGSITCNYDGKVKSRTTVGDDVFLGCNTNLVAPVSVGDGAYTAAGSTITENVPGDALAVARAKQVHKDGWARRRREK